MVCAARILGQAALFTVKLYLLRNDIYAKHGREKMSRFANEPLEHISLELVVILLMSRLANGPVKYISLEAAYTSYFCSWHAKTAERAI
jgi:hypothetical protein